MPSLVAVRGRAAGEGGRKRRAPLRRALRALALLLQRLVLAISPPQEGRAAAFPQEEAEETPGLKALEALDNVSVLRDESPLTSELLRAEVGALLALGRCRVVVSGPAPFNVAVAEMLEAQCEVDPTAITILAAQPGELQRARSSCGM